MPGHPPNHMVPKTKRLSKVRNLPQTKRRVFVQISEGGFNYCVYLNYEVEKNLLHTIITSLLKKMLFLNPGAKIMKFNTQIILLGSVLTPHYH